MNINILIVDDIEPNCDNIERKITLLEREGIDFTFEKALTYYGAKNIFSKSEFDLAIIDISLNGDDGVDLLKELNEISQDFEGILITAHDEKYVIKNAIEGMKYGAINFLKKDHEEFGEERFKSTINQVLDKIIEKKKAVQLQTAIVESLSNALNSRDGYTTLHSRNVSELTVAICRTAFDLSLLFDNFDPQQNHMVNRNRHLDRIRTVGLLHDIGKVGIPAKILLKPERLIAEERKLMELHSIEGAKIIEPIQFENDEKMMVKFHHAWYKEPLNKINGYPIPKEGESIPTITFALGLADAFDAMTSKRSYKRNNSYCIAIEQIFLSYEPMIPNYQVEKKGVQFHPHAIKAFFNSLSSASNIWNSLRTASFTLLSRR